MSFVFRLAKLFIMRITVMIMMMNMINFMLLDDIVIPSLYI